MVIIDPAISNNEDYLPYLAGIKADAYIKVGRYKNMAIFFFQAQGPYQVN